MKSTKSNTARLVHRSVYCDIDWLFGHVVVCADKGSIKEIRNPTPQEVCDRLTSIFNKLPDDAVGAEVVFKEHTTDGYGYCEGGDHFIIDYQSSITPEEIKEEKRIAEYALTEEDRRKKATIAREKKEYTRLRRKYGFP